MGFCRHWDDPPYDPDAAAEISRLSEENRRLRTLRLEAGVPAREDLIAAAAAIRWHAAIYRWHVLAGTPEPGVVKDVEAIERVLDWICELESARRQG